MLCSYTSLVDVATSSVRTEVGVRELKNHLSGYLERVARGEEVIVTDRGRPVARLSSVSSVSSVSSATNRLAELIASGVVTPPTSSTRQLPTRRIRASGLVSDLVAEQRR